MPPAWVTSSSKQMTVAPLLVSLRGTQEKRSKVSGILSPIASPFVNAQHLRRTSVYVNRSHCLVYLLQTSEHLQLILLESHPVSTWLHVCEMVSDSTEPLSYNRGWHLNYDPLVPGGQSRCPKAIHAFCCRSCTTLEARPGWDSLAGTEFSYAFAAVFQASNTSIFCGQARKYAHTVTIFTR